MLGLDEWRSGRDLLGWARPFVAAAAACRGPEKVKGGDVQLLRAWRRDQLARLSPKYAALEKERERGRKADIGTPLSSESQRALAKPLGWRLDAVARADENFGRELRRHLQQARRNIMSTFPSVFGPDPVLVEPVPG